jgi:hypothetical protein
LDFELSQTAQPSQARGYALLSSPDSADKPTDKPVSFWRRSDAILLAAFTVLSYLCALEYEKGYIDHFQVPAELLQVTPELLLLSALGLVLSVTGVFWTMKACVGLFYGGLQAKRAWAAIANFSLAIVLSIGYLLQRAYGLYAAFLILGLVVAVLVVLLAIEIGGSFITARKPKEMSWTTWIDQRITAATSEPAIFERLKQSMGFDVSMAVVVIVAALSGSYVLGAGSARENSQFQVSLQTNQVLLRNYGDVFILKDIDVQARKIGNATYIATHEQVSRLTFTRLVLRDVTVSTEAPKPVSVPLTD